MQQRKKIHIAIFASGAGSNAKAIITHFKDHPYAKIGLVVCNKPGAGVIGIAHDEQVPCMLLTREKFFSEETCLPELKSYHIDFIVLAGFLWKIPAALVDAYPRRIVNIHPALLPAYGGKGMYGNNVHQAVIDAAEKRSGITIHYVDEHYDQGDIILKVACDVLEGDTATDLAARIHELEHKHYPPTIENLVSSLR